jgi:hypothetical protein
MDLFLHIQLDIAASVADLRETWKMLTLTKKTKPGSDLEMYCVSWVISQQAIVVYKVLQPYKEVANSITHHQANIRGESHS